MKILKKIGKWFLIFLSLPVFYVLISLLLSSITIKQTSGNEDSNNQIYLTTNGVHLDIVIPKRHIDSLLLSGIKHNQEDEYISFGWGDENFYLNTPTWGDLTIKNAVGAMFLKSTTLLHITRYRRTYDGWIGIKVSDEELQKLNEYLFETFALNETGEKVILPNKGYSLTDDFYKANGSYTCINTCNSWVNSGFKYSGLKCSYWTPFDFGLINKYE